MAQIFICYRRDESAGHAGRVHDRLEREFGRDLLFMDVDAIPLGADFVKVLEAAVKKCDVLLAIIGPRWLEARDDDGDLRLEDENDFVRVEIAVALQREILVIPILLEGTRVPRAEHLPDDLKGLARCQGLDVRHGSFHSDMDKLVGSLRSLGEASPAADADRRSEGRIEVDAPIVQGAPDGWLLPGAGEAEWFQDIPDGSEMVVVPAGKFMMGSPPDEKGRSADELPRHAVTIASPFAVSRCPVTFAEWDAAQDDTDWDRHAGTAPRKPDDGGRGRGRRPLIHVSSEDAMAYCGWLSQMTGKPYRLLSEAEWEYCCRAGTTTAYAFGDTITKTQAHFRQGGVGGTTVEVASFPANSWGLHDMHGNVSEWVADNWHDNYRGAPEDGSVWEGGDTSLRVTRGGAWNNYPEFLRSSNRDRVKSDFRLNDIGFRVARTLARA